MTQAQFLRALARRLRGLPEAERDEALRYYKEYIEEAGLERGADVTGLVGTPEQAARGLLADSLIRQEREANMKSGWQSFRLVLLGILAAPVALPLAIAAFVLVIVVFAVLAALFVSGAAVAVAGAATVPAAFLMVGTLGQALIVVGYGLLMISVGVLLVLGAAALWRLAVRAVASLLRRKEGAAHA